MATVSHRSSQSVNGIRIRPAAAGATGADGSRQATELGGAWLADLLPDILLELALLHRCRRPLVVVDQQEIARPELFR